MVGAEPDNSKPKDPAAKGVDPDIHGEEVAVLTQAPHVPAPIKRKHATKVLVKLEVREVVKRGRSPDHQPGTPNPETRTRTIHPTKSD